MEFAFLQHLDMIKLRLGFVLLLLTFCLSLLPLWESVIVLCFCCTLLYVHSSIAIILMGKRELIALLNLLSWFLVVVERLFLAVPRGCLQFVIVVIPDHTHLLFLGNLTEFQCYCRNSSVKLKQKKSPTSLLGGFSSLI